MPNPIDPAQLAGQIQTAASEVIGKNVTLIQGFSQQQVNAIVQQSVDIAAGVADGSIDAPTRDYFLSSLQELVRSFVNTLAGLVTVVVEELWNAVVGVVWGAINKATGLSLVAP